MRCVVSSLLRCALSKGHTKCLSCKLPLSAYAVCFACSQSKHCEQSVSIWDTSLAEGVECHKHCEHSRSLWDVSLAEDAKFNFMLVNDIILLWQEQAQFPLESWLLCPAFVNLTDTTVFHCV